MQRGRALLMALLLAGAACSEPVSVTVSGPQSKAVDLPAARGALAPDLAILDGSLAATWLEPTVLDGRPGHRLQFSRLLAETWSAPVTISEGLEFFANWADLPGVVEAGNGELFAHWLAKTGSDTYAYSIFLARSSDGGESWRPEGKLNSDAIEAEHGFVSWIAEDRGARAFWLDGREMPTGGSMSLRTAAVGEAAGPGEVLDERTCECCSTSVAGTTDGPIVVYRDRSAGEIRDVGVVRRDGEGWSTPKIVHVDGWRIEGCPVNGPEVAARGDEAVVAWFTGAGSAAEGSEPAVNVAFSSDGGRRFGAPIVVDGTSPLGRVDVAVDEAGRAWVSWMRQVGDVAEVRLQQTSQGGALGESLLAAVTSPARAAGFPRLVYLDEALYLCWVDLAGDEPGTIRLQRYSLP